MIPHALARNLVLPFFTLAYLLYKRYPRQLEWVYIISYVGLLCSLPVYIILVLCGYNPMVWFISDGWRSSLSLIQYLLFILASLGLIFIHTFDHAYSFTCAVLGSGAVGYLYEVPRWLNVGWWALFRTAKNSPMILDWGMLSVPILIWLLWGKVNLRSWITAPILTYFAYVVYYYGLTAYYVSTIYPILGIATNVLCRIPAMLLILSLFTMIKPRALENMEQN